MRPVGATGRGNSRRLWESPTGEEREQAQAVVPVQRGERSSRKSRSAFEHGLDSSYLSGRWNFHEQLLDDAWNYATDQDLAAIV
jgi:hypothetical protein